MRIAYHNVAINGAWLRRTRPIDNQVVIHAGHSIPWRKDEERSNRYKQKDGMIEDRRGPCISGAC